MTDDKKLVLQTTIDNLLYLEGYKEKLEEFNRQFENYIVNVKFSHDTNKFLFPLDKAI